MTGEGRIERTPSRGDAWAAASGLAARWIAFSLDLWAPRTWFGPSWAFLGGILSGAHWTLQVRSLVILAIGWLVSEPLIGSLLAWSVEMARVRQESQTVPFPKVRWTLPYLRPRSPGQRGLDFLAEWVARLRQAWSVPEGAGEQWGVLALMTLLLSAVVGEQALLLGVVAVLVGLGVALGRPLRSEVCGLLGALHFLLSWLVGRVVFSPIDPWVFFLGMGFAVLWYAWTQRPPRAWLLAIADILLGGLLVVLRAPLSAAGLLLLTVPVFMLWPDSPTSQRAYLSHTQLYLMVGLLLAAGGLAWRF